MAGHPNELAGGKQPDGPARLDQPIGARGVVHLGVHDLPGQAVLRAPARPRPVHQPVGSALLGAVQPRADSVLAYLKDLRNLRHRVAAGAQQHHLGTFGHPAHRSPPQPPQDLPLVLGQRPNPDHPSCPPRRRALTGRNVPFFRSHAKNLSDNPLPLR